ncbi:hypothetical protein BKA81DRAFT_424267 [Phyllosticta paracitricarpa]
MVVYTYIPHYYLYPPSAASSIGGRTATERTGAEWNRQPFSRVAARSPAKQRRGINTQPRRSAHDGRRNPTLPFPVIFRPSEPPPPASPSSHCAIIGLLANPAVPASNAPQHQCFSASRKAVSLEPRPFACRGRTGVPQGVAWRPVRREVKAKRFDRRRPSPIIAIAYLS